MPELAPCPWTALTHLSQSPAVTGGPLVTTYDVVLTIHAPSVSFAAVPELAPCPWTALIHLSQSPAVTEGPLVIVHDVVHTIHLLSQLLLCPS